MLMSIYFLSLYCLNELDRNLSTLLIIIGERGTLDLFITLDRIFNTFPFNMVLVVRFSI